MRSSAHGSAPRPVPGWSACAQAVAWFKAWLQARCVRDARLLELARRELRALGVDVAPAGGKGLR